MKKLSFIILSLILSFCAFGQKDKSDKVDTRFLQLPMYDISSVDPSSVTATFASGDVMFGENRIKDTKTLCVPSGGGLKDAVEVSTYYYEVAVTIPASYLVAKDADGNTLYAEQVSKKENGSVNFGFEECSYWIAENMKKDWKKNKENFQIEQQKIIEKDLANRARELAAVNIYPAYINEQLKVYSAKGKFDYTKLEEAQELALLAYEKIEKVGPNIKSFQEIEKAIAIWEEEISTLDTEDRKARISTSVGKGIYENLANAYTYTYKFDKAVNAAKKARELFGNFSNNRSMELDEQIELLYSRIITAEKNAEILSDVNKLTFIAESIKDADVELNVLPASDLTSLANEHEAFVSEHVTAMREAEKKEYEEGVASGEINPYEQYVTQSATQGKMIYMTPLLAPDLTVLPEEICCIEDLKQITITGNNIASIPSGIRQLTELTTLNLSNNKISMLPPEIGFLTNLKTLNLSGNPITEIPEEIKNCTSIKKLNLKRTNLTGDQQKAIAQLLPDAKIKF